MRKTKNNSDENWESRSKQQDQRAAIPVTFEELVNNPEKYATPPAFQRKKVWGISDKQAFIDSMALGMVHVEFDAFKEAIQGKTFYRLINGFQRLNTMIEFYNDGFRTWTPAQKQLAEPNSDPPALKPGVVFSQLPLEDRNRLAEFVSHIHLVPPDMPMSQIITYFLRIQNQTPLSSAERLSVYISATAKAAMKIGEHEFWGDIYCGKTNRKQIYQTSLQLLALEIGPMDSVDLASTKFLHKLAAGIYDKEITDAVVNSVLTRLDDICFLYAGAQFTRRTIAVAMYQSALLVEEAGYTTRTGDKGRLTSWIDGVIAESSHATLIPNYSCPIQQILRPASRKVFWDRHLKTILALLGINKPDVAA